jgi:cob(I)alamin adenosyltransferase
MKIYTKTGDSGETGLFSGRRVSKTHGLVEAYGTLDELNSCLGVVLACGPGPQVCEEVTRLQVLLFQAGADLATEANSRPVDRIDEGDVRDLETRIDRISSTLPASKAFVMPGGAPAAAHLHVARTVCRRAERDAIAAAADSPVNPHLLVWLNRLSDFLFLLARLANQEAGIPEPLWKPEKA